jgi:hypothetical protein
MTILTKQAVDSVVQSLRASMYAWLCDSLEYRKFEWDPTRFQVSIGRIELRFSAPGPVVEYGAFRWVKGEAEYLYGLGQIAFARHVLELSQDDFEKVVQGAAAKTE